MPGYKVREIREIVDGKFHKKGENSLVEHLCTDSRKVDHPFRSLFFAIKGDRQDGHKFVQDAADRGIRNFIVSKKVKVQSNWPLNIILVPDVLLALQNLCKHHREQHRIPIIGVTGSNGKTTVKEWLNELMHDDYNIAKSPKSYNSQIGVPLSVWQLDDRHELGIFEAGISEKNEMEHLHEIIQPDIVIFTNIGPAHDSGFKNTKEKIKEKLKLSGDSGMLIYRKDYAEIEKVLFKSKQSIRSLSWSTKDESANIYFKLNTKENHTEVSASYRMMEFNFNLPFKDASNIENALHCCCVLMCDSNYHSNEILNKKLSRLYSVPMRLEQRAGINNCILIDDSYNADVQSLKIALDFQQQQNRHLKNTLVLTDILQTGKEPEKLYKEIASLVNKKKLHRIIGIGNEITSYSNKFSKIPNTTFYKDVDTLLDELEKLNFDSECVLFKGARKFQLERMVAALSQKIHRTVLEVDLNAITNNLNVYKSKLKPETKIMAMVKARSYGAGSSEIASVLQFNKVDYLSVAYADEGVALRKSGIKTPIMVLNPHLEAFEAILKYKLEPEIYSINQLDGFLNLLGSLQKKVKLPIHINLDTGMNRLGFADDDIEELIGLIQSSKQLKVKSVFSHLSASDDLAAKTETLSQIKHFKNSCKTFEKGLKLDFLKHILNTSGISNYTYHQMDMVRLGLGLYGLDPNAKVQKKLQLSSRLKTYISQIKEVKRGERIGYGLSAKIKKKTKIATISIGYGDGLPRLAGNGKFQVKVNGELAPTIGNICMDMCMIDVGHIADVQEGDQVTIFDDPVSVRTLAESCQTIPYEILAGINERVKRVYFQD